jgi:5'-nucleotidase
MSSRTRLVLAIASSALFDLRQSDAVFRREGLQAYRAYQVAQEKQVLEPGAAFSLVSKLLALGAEGLVEVEVILLSRNSADTGLRVFNSIQAHGLDIRRAAFTGGAAPYRYMRPFGCHLFLSANPIDVVDALDNGFAAASVLPGSVRHQEGPRIRFAFDGDAVLFSDVAERLYQSDGLDAFTAQEQAAADEPLPRGPFAAFLTQLHKVQSVYSEDTCPIETALVTARSAPAHERVIKTLRSWGIRLDESLFLGGLDKTEFLAAYGADIFFDDQAEHCHLASRVVVSGHVPHGVKNPR